MSINLKKPGYTNMKHIHLFLALALLAGCAAQPVADTSEERNAWLEEQAALAGEFLDEHRDLLDEIAAVILETEIAEQYLEFYICPGYSDDGPHLDSFRRTSDKYGCYQGCGAIDPKLTLAGLSVELDLLTKELCALRPMGISYSNKESVHSLQIGFAAESFSGGACLCDVNLDCEIDGAHDWTVISDWHYMPE